MRGRLRKFCGFVPFWASLFLFVSCAGSMVPGEEVVIQKSASSKPRWILVPPHNTEDVLYFVGIATHAPTLEKGKEMARANAAAQVAQFFGTKVEYSYTSSYQYGSSSGQDDYVSAFTNVVASKVVKGLTLEDLYYEKVKYADEDGKVRVGYNVYALYSIGRGTFRKMAQESIEEVDEQFKEAGTYETMRDRREALLKELDQILGK